MRLRRPALVVAVALAVAAVLVPMSAVPSLRPSPGAFVLEVAIAASGVVLVALALFGRRSSEFVRVRTAAARRRMPQTLEPGGSYVLLGPDPSRAYGIFATYVNAGARGLVLSRLYPDEVRARHAVRASGVLWLSRGSGPTSVSPTNLERIVREIERVVSGREASIVLLEGLEYLVGQNGAREVGRFLERLTDAVSTHLSRLVVPLDPAKVSTAELPVLTRDLRKL